MTTFLGIDGGGTRTRALLVDATGRVLSETQDGPSNLNHASETTVCTSLQSVIRTCTEKTNTPPVAICLGLAGATSPEVANMVTSFVRELVPSRIEVISDAEVALAGAFADGPGILLIAGTGSVCLGQTTDHTFVRSGGWGQLVDDAGSASWIGRQALSESLRQADGRASPTELRDNIFAALGVSNRGQIIERLYRPSMNPTQLGQLAPSVCEMAEAGDRSARKICVAAVNELDQLVRAVAKKMCKSERRVCFTGGLLEHQPFIRERLRERLKPCEIIPPMLTPVSGAVLRAAALAGPVEKNFQRKVCEFSTRSISQAPSTFRK